ncbi:MAG: hypothetical protein ABJQ29_11380 [Luteolibacter sp.]
MKIHQDFSKNDAITKDALRGDSRGGAKNASLSGAASEFSCLQRDARHLRAFNGTDANPDQGFDQPIPRTAAYWTLWRGGDDAERMRAMDEPTGNRPTLPHERLCICGFDSPLKLMADFLSKGWAEDSFDGAVDRLALIETTERGIVVTLFENYQAACHAHALSVQ